MKVKKILIVTECFYPEEFKVNEVALDWKERGYEVDVLTMVPTYPASKVFDGYENIWYQKDSYRGIKIYRVKAVTGYKYSLFKKLLKYIAFMILGSIISIKIGKKYDYIFGFNAGPLTAMVPAVILNLFYKKDVTLWVQDVWPDSVYAYGFKKTKVLEFFLNRLVEFVYKYTSRFAISGEGFKKRIIPYLKCEKEILYAPNWADQLNTNLEPFKFSEGDKINFTFAGNIGKVQNLDNIIKAFGMLPKKYLNNAQLNIIGDGSELNNLRGATEKSMFNNIVFLGRKPREEMYKYLKGSDFLIVSLIKEPIFSLTVPAKVQTYIASYKPIIAIMDGDACDLIKNNDLGLTAQPDDVKEIQNIIIQAINMDKNKIQEFTKNSERLTKTVFNKNIIISDLLNLTVKDRV